MVKMFLSIWVGNKLVNLYLNLQQFSDRNFTIIYNEYKFISLNFFV